MVSPNGIADVIGTIYNVIINGTKFWLEETKAYHVISKKTTDCSK